VLFDNSIIIALSKVYLSWMKKVSLLLVLSITAARLLSQQNGVSQEVHNRAVKLEEKMISWRRDFHSHPELGNREFRTSKIIADHLRSLGIEVREGVGKTGVVGILRGAKAGPCVGLRADIDALPIEERTGLPFASRVKAEYNGQTVSVMHACGHDSHIAIMMTVAEILAGMKDQLKGTVKFVFQPAEEGPPEGEEGGAPLMIKEGALENPKVDVMFGLHINSQTEVGIIKYRSGSMMAASDWFTIKVKGKGSHGSQPWMAVDPVVVSAQIINALQTIVSRQIDLTRNPAVLSVCVVNGGVRANIIPEEVTLTGTIRTFDKESQKEIHEKIRAIATHTAEASGAKAEVTIDNKTLVTYNDPMLVNRMLPTFRRVAGEQNVYEMTLVTGSEDFSFFAEKVPSIFFYLGGMKKGQDSATAFPHHTPDFVIDESGFRLGAETFCNLVFDYLNEEAKKKSK
jgi:amidohydrolase